VQLWIHCTVIQGSRDQRLFDSYPELIAVFHALHRLLAPRHPPHALSSLAALFLPSDPMPTPFLRTARASDSKNRIKPRLAPRFREGNREVVTYLSFSKARVEFASTLPYPSCEGLDRVEDATLFTHTELSKSHGRFRPMFDPRGAVASGIHFRGVCGAVELLCLAIGSQASTDRECFLRFHLTGDDGDRTRDLLVANQALSQLSYIPVLSVVFSPWSYATDNGRRTTDEWAYLDSNQGPQLYQSCALAN
jgi:hypothetical protein